MERLGFCPTNPSPRKRDDLSSEVTDVVGSPGRDEARAAENTDGTFRAAAEASAVMVMAAPSIMLAPQTKVYPLQDMPRKVVQRQEDLEVVLNM